MFISFHNICTSFIRYRAIKPPSKSFFSFLLQYISQTWRCMRKPLIYLSSVSKTLLESTLKQFSFITTKIRDFHNSYSCISAMIRMDMMDMMIPSDIGRPELICYKIKCLIIKYLVISSSLSPYFPFRSFFIHLRVFFFSIFCTYLTNVW